MKEQGRGIGQVPMGASSDETSDAENALPASLPEVLFVDSEQLETITDKHYRTFGLPCAPLDLPSTPFRERLKRGKP